MEEIVSRYASAIVSIAKDEKKLMQYKVAFFDLENKLSNNPDIQNFLKSYFIHENDKFLIIDELCSSYDLNNLNNFVKLLVKKHQISRFKDIAKEINKTINEELNVYEGFVFTTEPLTEEKLNEIELVISKKLNHKVELVNKLDKRLIGGIKVVVHDHVFDGSIKYKLENLKQNLKERRTTDEN